ALHFRIRLWRRTRAGGLRRCPSLHQARRLSDAGGSPRRPYETRKSLSRVRQSWSGTITAARGWTGFQPARRMMTNTARDVFITGLRNAHAMEVQARELMERQSERLGDYPDVQARVKQHLVETNQHLKRLEQCLQG